MRRYYYIVILRSGMTRWSDAFLTSSHRLAAIRQEVDGGEEGQFILLSGLFELSYVSDVLYPSEAAERAD